MPDHSDAAEFKSSEEEQKQKWCHDRKLDRHSTGSLGTTSRKTIAAPNLVSRRFGGRLS
ncbi:hypothetical protein RRSWK_00232 [Rhodopirellula sp. SWK7]|nr:hypothetical protein RRSWK_00232 [Rhodopirellula sp. SWK7]